MAELIFPRRSGERISHDSRLSDAAKAWCDRSECAYRSVARPCAARALKVGLVLVSLLGTLSVAAGNAHGQPTLPVSAQQESFAFGIDSFVLPVTRTGTAEGERNDSVTLVQDKPLPNAGLLRWNITLAAHDTDTDTAESARTGSEPP